MASIGNLVVNLSANTNKFNKNITRSRLLVRAFASGINKAGRVTAVGAMAAMGVAVVAVTRQLESLDKVAKLSGRTGFDPSTIAAFGFAAEQSGSSVETSNKALDQFTRRMGDAADGTGEAATMLKQLGIPMADMQQLSPEDQLLKVADAIAALPDKAQQANAAYQMFGRSGQELVTVLAQGSDGIKEFQAEADKLGLGFSSEELAKVEAANDAMNRIKRAAGAAASVLTVRVAPAIESVATWFTGAADSAGGFGAMMSKTATFIGDTWKWLQDSIAVGITAAMAVGEWAVKNFGTIMKFVAIENARAFVTLANQIEHLFTVKIPAVATWFADNWQDILFTAFDYTTTLMVNLGKNIRAIWQATLDFIKGKGFNPDYTDMLEGARSAISKMPDIPERVQGDLEKSLSKQADDLKDSLKGSFADTVTARLDTLRDMQRMAAAGQPDLKPPEPPKFDPADIGGLDTETATPDGGKAQEKQFAGAMQRGSEEAFKLLVQSMSGGQKPELKEAKKQTKLLGKIAQKKSPDLDLQVQEKA